MNEFDKIFGYESEKQEMLRLCDVLCNRKKYESLGITLPKAVLFYGEPGLGKTLMAKAFIAATGRKVFHCKKNKSNGEFVDEIKSTFENAIKEHRLLYSLTIWINLPKITCNRIVTKRNLLQFKQGWKISSIKMFS